MRKIIRFFRTYFPFARSIVMIRMQYRVGFYFWVFNSVLKVAVVYFLWSAVYQNSADSVIAGFGFHEIVAYLVVTEATSWMVKTNSENRIAHEVKSGQIAVSLIRPINYTLLNLFNAFGKTLFSLFTVAIPLIGVLTAYRYFALHLAPPDVVHILAYVLSLAFSFLIMFFLDTAFGMLSFYTTNLWGLTVTKTVTVDLLSGSLFPLSFFPLGLQHALAFLPFSSVIFFPVMIWLGKINGAELPKTLAIQAFWALALFGINRLVWNRAFKRLTILGG